MKPKRFHQLSILLSIIGLLVAVWQIPEIRRWYYSNNSEKEIISSPPKPDNREKFKPTELENTHQQKEDKYILTGVVFHSENREPISDVNIEFGSQRIHTDKFGKFILPCTNKSENKIVIHKDGFEEYTDYKTPPDNIQVKLTPIK